MLNRTTPARCGPTTTGALLLALLLAVPSAAPAFTLALRPLGVTNGLAARVAVALLVDRNGFLWVGSREGLYRYDGYRAVRYVPDAAEPGAITDLDIRALYEDEDGVIWVATNTGGLNRFDAARGRFTHFRHDPSDPASLGHDSVYGMVVGPDGGLWMGTQIGLNRLDRATGRFTRYRHDAGDPGSLSHDYVFTVFVDHAGDLWVATVGGGLSRWQPGTDTFERFDLSDLTGMGKELNDTFALAEDAEGVLWVGTRSGLVSLDAERRRARFHRLGGESDSQPLITAMASTDTGEILVATMAHGLLRVAPATGEFGPSGGSLIEPGVPLMSLARSGPAIFLGTWGQGVLFGRRGESEYGLVPGGKGGELRNDTVSSILATGEVGWPWVGTFGGGLQRVDASAGTAEPPPYGTDSKLALAGVMSMARDPDGRLFAGSTEGLWVVEPAGGRAHLMVHDPEQPGSLGEGYVTTLLRDSRGRLWVGVGGSGLYLMGEDGVTFTPHRADPADPGSLGGDYITALLEAPDGVLWVGTRSSGLNRCRMDPWSCERFPASPASDQSLGHHHVTDLIRDSLGRIWVATDGGGLHQVEFGPGGEVSGFRRWTSHEGLLSDSVMALGEDRDGTLWISSRDGLTRLDPDTGKTANLVAEMGLPVSHFYSGASDSDPSAIYFGGVGGLLVVPKGQPFPEQRPSPVRITHIDSPAFREAVLLPAWELDRHVLAYGDALSIEFAVLDFAESLHQYEYRLSPDDPWTPLGSRHELNFFGLPPGEHRFEVRGRDIQALWSQAPPLQLLVVPPFWMTAWFRVLVLLTVGLVAFAAPALRVRELRRRNAELTRLKSQREAALAQVQESEAELKLAYEGLSRLTRRLESAKEEERQHISRELHDQLGQTLTAAKIHLQLLQKDLARSLPDDRLDEAVAMMDEMLRKVRAVSLNLRPPLLDEAGLVPCLEHYLAGLEKTTGVGLELDVEPSLPAFRPAVETVLFRVVQEAVSNSLRHSGAGRIRVALATEEGAVRAEIADDGRGFDVAQVRRLAHRGDHLGLLGIGERLRSVGGELEMDSERGRGTRITARIPL